MSSLESITDELQKFVDSLKFVAHCSKIANSILKLRESALALSSYTDKLNVPDTDFLAYGNQLKKSIEILISLEAPSKELNISAQQLFSLFREILFGKQLTEDNFRQIKDLLDRTMTTATRFYDGVLEFKRFMEQTRNFCESAKKNAESEAEKLQNAASGARAGIQKRKVIAGLGAAALVLGIAGVLTGGTALVAASIVGAKFSAIAVAGVGAGAVGTGFGTAGMVAGKSIAEAAVLSASALQEKADKFHDTVKKIEVARAGVERLENDMKGGVLKLSADVMQALEAGLQLYGKMEEDRRKMEDDIRKIEEYEKKMEEYEKKVEEDRKKMEEYEKKMEEDRKKMDESTKENQQLEGEKAALLEEIRKLKLSKGE